MSQTTVAVRVDGRVLTGRDGEPLIELLERGGVGLPHVCYHPSLRPLETCDGCLVERDGELVRACAVAVSADLEVAAATPRAEAARHEAVERLLKNHELYCTACDNNNARCEVKAAYQKVGITHPRYPFAPKPYPVDASHPFYRYDPGQCILCGRCVEACQNLQVNETLTLDWSLPRPRVVWDGGVPAGESSCVSCGHCVTVCPCNALMEKSMLGEAGPLTGIEEGLKRAMVEVVKSVEPFTGYAPIAALSDVDAALRVQEIRRTKTVCTYCGVGCSFEMWTRGRKILKVEPTPASPANGVSTCIKGKFGWDFVNSKERLTRPLVRDGGRFRETSWEEALDRVARRLGEIRAAHGADAIGVIASSKCSNEEAYLVQKLARAVLGTNNVDNCSRYCQAPATTGLWRTVGYGGDAGTIRDIEQADLVLIVGSNTAESHPVLATRVKRAHKLRGQKLVVADLRRHEMAERADLFLRPNPGTDLVWLSAVTRFILDRGLAASSFLEERVEGLEAYRASLAPFTLAFAEQVTGIPAAVLERVALMVAASERVCALWAMGVTQHCGGSDTSTAISNLLLVTGNYGRPGTGGYPLRGHNNVQGTSDFGAMPAFFPGYEPVASEAVRSRYEAGWGVSLPAGKGLDNHEMVDAIHDGRLRAMVVVGEDMSIVDANAGRVQAAFEQLDLLVVQEVFMSRTAEFADVVLPASPSLEKEGTFTNTERRIQRFERVMEPLGESRPDWRILVDLARRLGADWGYAHPREILAEAAGLSPMFAGVTWERLEGYGSLHWPVAPDGTDSPLLYTERFNFPSGRARLHPLEWIPPCEEAGGEYDLHLNNGRLLEHFHQGNLTYRSPGIRGMAPQTFVELSPELAAERGVEDGGRVRLVSRRGAVTVRALISDRVRGRELYLPMSSTEAPVNLLTGDAVDRTTHTPAFKEVAVRLEVLPGEAAPALPRGNFRHGRRTPAAGVEVGQKWARSDWVAPPGHAPDGGGL